MEQRDGRVFASVPQVRVGPDRPGRRKLLVTYRGQPLIRSLTCAAGEVADVRAILVEGLKGLYLAEANDEPSTKEAECEVPRI